MERAIINFYHVWFNKKVEQTSAGSAIIRLASMKNNLLTELPVVLIKCRKFSFVFLVPL